MALPDTTDLTVVQTVLVGVGLAVALLLLSLLVAFAYHKGQRWWKRRKHAG